MKQLLTLLLLVACAASAEGATRRAVRCSQPAARANDEVVVVPFAIPVAVPVAVVQQPTLFYGYSRYVAPREASTSVTPTAFARDSSDAASNDRSAVEILAAHCAACHGGASSQGGLRMFDDELRIISRLPRHVILEMAARDGSGEQRMPPGERPKLTDEEIEVLREWARLPRDAVY